MKDGDFDLLRAELLDAVGEATDSAGLRGRLFGTGGLLIKLGAQAATHGEEIRVLQDLVFRRLADLDKQTELERTKFDEFKQRDFTDWKRVRSAIEHENTLTNHRLTWLFSSQAFLLTAYTLAFNQWAKKAELATDAVSLYPALLLIIAAAGILMCAVVRRGLTAALLQLNRLDNWWHLGPEWENVEHDIRPNDPVRHVARQKLSFRHPPLQGELRHPLDPLISSDAIPYYFMFAWLAIISFTILRQLPEVWKAVQERGQQALTAAALAGCIILGLLLHRKHRELRRRELASQSREYLGVHPSILGDRTLMLESKARQDFPEKRESEANQDANGSSTAHHSAAQTMMASDDKRSS